MKADLETLQNDADALAFCRDLARWAAEAETDLAAGLPADVDEIARDLRALLSDGAAGRDACALEAWARERLSETENSIAALDGSGMPEPVYDKPSAKYIDVEITYFARVPKADLTEEYVDDDITDTETQNRLAFETVEQWIHDGEVLEEHTTTHTDEE
jgi:hypothetical protein